MKKLLLILIFSLLLFANFTIAQQLFINTNVQNAILKDTRTSTGKAGKNVLAKQREL